MKEQELMGEINAAIDALRGKTTKKEKEPASISVGAVAYEAIGKHIHCRLEHNAEDKSSILVVEGAAGMPDVDVVENEDEGKMGLLFQSREALQELKLFLEQVV